MINDIYITQGLGGVGKTKALEDEVKALLKDNKKIQYLCFNKKLKERSEERFGYISHLAINTVHSLCYRTLDLLKKLPEEFGNGSKELPHHKLISIFLKLEEKDLIPTLPNIDVLLIDEVQDFEKDYMKVIEKIGKVQDFDIHVYGDPTQQINANYTSKVAKQFNCFEYLEDMGTIKGIRFLNHNYRVKNHTLLKFMNGYLKKMHPCLSESLQYSNELEETKYKFKKPEIRWFKHKNEEYKYITSQVKMIPANESILIISRYKKNLKQIEDSKLSDMTNVSISSIHISKGHEADHVFLCGFEPKKLTDEIEKNILYVGISRAIKSLTISSSYKKTDLLDIFEKGSFIEKGKQAWITQLRKKLKVLKEDKNFSKSILENNIDSIICSVPYIDVPFLPYVENEFIQNKKYDSKSNGVTYSSKKCQNSRILYIDGVCFTLRYHHSSMGYFFDFYDLNLLKKNKYSDLDILYFVSNIVIKFFDYRISYDQINISRLDICKVVKYESESSKKDALDEIGKELESGKFNSLKTHEGDNIQKESKKIKNALMNKTVYANFSKRKNSTLVLYDPKNKNNKNKVHMNNIFKYELRLKNDILRNKYSSDVKNMEILMKTVSDKKLIGFYDSILKRKNIKLNLNN